MNCFVTANEDLTEGLNLDVSLWEESVWVSLIHTILGKEKILGFFFFLITVVIFLLFCLACFYRLFKTGGDDSSDFIYTFLMKGITTLDLNIKILGLAHK